MSFFHRLKNSYRLKVLLQKIAKICLIPVAIIIVIVWYIIDKFKRIRVYNIGDMGNFGFQLRFPEHYLRDITIECKQTDGKLIRLFASGTSHIFLVYDPTNKFLLTMLEREIKIINSRLLSTVFELMAPILRTSRNYRDDHHIKDDQEHFKRYGVRADGTRPRPGLHFSSEEMVRGRHFLEELQIGEKDWWFCFHNRDEAFYSRESNAPRNMSVEKYLKAAGKVVEAGGYGFRMGSVAEERLGEDVDPRIIDYVNKYRSEFLDIFLMAHCRFFVGNTSGVRLTPLIFNRPVALANELCIIPRSLSDLDLWIPCQIINLENGSYLPFSKRLEIERQRNNTYRKLYAEGIYDNYKIEPNTSDDIAELTSDLMKKIDGIPLNEDDKYRLSTFQGIIGHKHPYQPSPSFLKKWEDLLS